MKIFEITNKVHFFEEYFDQNWAIKNISALSIQLFYEILSIQASARADFFYRYFMPQWVTNAYNSLDHLIIFLDWLVGLNTSEQRLKFYTHFLKDFKPQSIDEVIRLMNFLGIEPKEREAFFQKPDHIAWTQSIREGYIHDFFNFLGRSFVSKQDRVDRLNEYLPSKNLASDKVNYWTFFA